MPALFQFPLDRVLEQQRQRRHEDVRLHAPRRLMIDRPHLDHIFEIAQSPLDCHQLLVVAHRLHGRQVLLLALDQRLALQRLLARQLLRIFEIAEAPRFVCPPKVALPFALADGGCGGALRRRARPAASAAQLGRRRILAAASAPARARKAGCKTVIGSRCKQSAMFWTVRGANAILALRCCQFDGRFEDYWEARRA